MTERDLDEFISPLDEAINAAYEDLSGGEEDPTPSESRTETLMKYMQALSFRLRDAKESGTLEFHKTYSDPSGRLGRVVAVIKLDDVGLEPKYVDYFNVTMQMNVPSDESIVEKKAPAFARDDILRILAHFIETGEERNLGPEVTCASCGVMTVEFATNGEGQKVCLDCDKLGV